jgi:Ni,Fe-hydrogenase I cytochrome b subunit
MKSRLLPLVIHSAIFILVFLLPVLPVQQAAVVPHPVYSLALVSLFDLACIFRVGVRYIWEWYTFISIAVLAILGIWVGRVIVRKTNERNADLLQGGK